MTKATEERRWGMQELIEAVQRLEGRVERIDGKVTVLTTSLSDHVDDENAKLVMSAEQSSGNGRKIDRLGERLGGVENHLAKQKGFVAGALFVVTALSLVLMEGVRKLLGIAT